MTEKAKSKSSKIELQSIDPIFDLKFMLVGSPGAGKTHLAGTYTGGPVHFYMCDPGGEKTLRKLLKDRPDHSPITVDTFLRRNQQNYNSFWNQLQSDAKAGFFEEMASKNGLVVFDSMTSILMLATDSIAKKNNRNPNEQPAFGGFRMQEWGQRSAWLTELTRVINDLPCATAVLCHLKRLEDQNTRTILESLNLPGQLSDNAGNWFDEVYKLTSIADKLRIFFRPDGRFDQAKTRVFSEPSYDFQLGELALDIIINAYFNDGKFPKKPKGRK